MSLMCFFNGGDFFATFSGVVNSSFITKKGDRFKKGADLTITRAGLFLRDYLAYRSRNALSEKHHALQDDSARKIQRFYLARRPFSLYYWRVSRITLYGEKIHIETRIKQVRETTPYNPEKMSYWLSRLDALSEKINSSLTSPKVVILKQEIEHIQGNSAHHHNEINVIDKEIEALKQKRNYHLTAIAHNGQQVEKINTQIISVIDAEYDETLKKAQDDYEMAFYTWGENLGIPKTALAPNGTRDENLYKAYVSGNPFKPPERPSAKVVKKPKQPKAPRHVKAGGDKKAKAPPQPKAENSDELCRAIKLFKDDESPKGWGGWCQCENYALKGQITCKRHTKNITGGGEGLVGQLGDKYANDNSKWFKYVLGPSPHAKANREIAGL